MVSRFIKDRRLNICRRECRFFFQQHHFYTHTHTKVSRTFLVYANSERSIILKWLTISKLIKRRSWFCVLVACLCLRSFIHPTKKYIREREDWRRRRNFATRTKILFWINFFKMKTIQLFFKIKNFVWFNLTLFSKFINKHHVISLEF